MGSRLKEIRLAAYFARERLRWDVARVVTDALGRWTPWTMASASDPSAVESLLRRLHPVEAPTGLRRLGPSSDGGYLVPDDLEGIDALFSPGVGEVVGFESACADLGMRVHLADGSVGGLPVTDDRLDFLAAFVGAVDGPETTTLASWVERCEPDAAADLLLQMDVEGAEWVTLLAAPDELLARFRVMVVEFHRLHGMFEASMLPVIAAVFDRILRTHVCVHIHPNNAMGAVERAGIVVPRVAEFTFLRRDRIDDSQLEYASRFPHPLDADCLPFETLVLPQSMWRAPADR